MKDFKEKMVKKLLAYGKIIEESYSKTELDFTPDKKADKFILHSVISFEIEDCPSQ